MNLSAVQPFSGFEGDDEEDEGLCRELFGRSEKYLASFKWCGQILERYIGICVGGIVAVLLFKIQPLRADEWVWTVIGDLPPAYISVDGNETPSRALHAYIDELRKWVSAAKGAQDVSGLIPVNIEPTPANAERLERRLNYLEHEILPDYEEES